MVEENKNFIEKIANDFMGWVFQSELKKFDNLANELKQQHESPSSYDIKDQLSYLKEHLNGHKIPTYANLQDNIEVEKVGLVDEHNQGG